MSCVKAFATNCAFSGGLLVTLLVLCNTCCYKHPMLILIDTLTNSCICWRYPLLFHALPEVVELVLLDVVHLLHHVVPDKEAMTLVSSILRVHSRFDWPGIYAKYIAPECLPHFRHGAKT
eukprot:2747710-Amphidinium_carterae.1